MFWLWDKNHIEGVRDITSYCVDYHKQRKCNLIFEKVKNFKFEFEKNIDERNPIDMIRETLSHYNWFKWIQIPSAFSQLVDECESAQFWSIRKDSLRYCKIDEEYGSKYSFKIQRNWFACGESMPLRIPFQFPIMNFFNFEKK